MKNNAGKGLCHNGRNGSFDGGCSKKNENDTAENKTGTVTEKNEVSAKKMDPFIGTYKIGTENLIDQLLMEIGVYKSNPDYAYRKSIIREDIESDPDYYSDYYFSGYDKMELIIGLDNAHYVGQEGEDDTGDVDYKVDSDRILYLNIDGKWTLIGFFDDSYKGFYVTYNYGSDHMVYITKQ